MDKNRKHDEKSYLTRSEVARILQVSPTTVTRWAHEGRLPSQLTLGGHHRFEKSVVEQLRETLRSEGSAEPAAVGHRGPGQVD